MDWPEQPHPNDGAASYGQTRDSNVLRLELQAAYSNLLSLTQSLHETEGQGQGEADLQSGSIWPEDPTTATSAANNVPQQGAGVDTGAILQLLREMRPMTGLSAIEGADLVMGGGPRWTAPTAVMIPPTAPTDLTIMPSTAFTDANNMNEDDDMDTDSIQADDMDADDNEANNRDADDIGDRYPTRLCLGCREPFSFEGDDFPSCWHCDTDTGMCAECLERAFDIAARDLGRMNSQFPPMCPVGEPRGREGAHQIPLETIELIVRPEKLAWYRIALQEAQTPLDDRTYCLYCGTFCPNTAGEGEAEAMVGANVAFSTAFCPKCSKYTTCRVCREAAHPKGKGWYEYDREGDQFDAYGERVILAGACHGPGGRETAEDKDFRQMALDQGMAPCPGCNAVVDKLDGCAFVECLCGTVFCFRCLKPEDDCECTSDGYDTPPPDDELRGDGLGWIDRDSGDDAQVQHAKKSQAQQQRQEETQEARDRRRARHRRRRHLNRRYLRRQARRQAQEQEMEKASMAYGAVDIGDMDISDFEAEDVEELDSDDGNEADIDLDSDDDNLEVDPDSDKGEDYGAEGPKMCAPADDDLEFDDDYGDDDASGASDESVDHAALGGPAEGAIPASNDLAYEEIGDEGSRSGRGEENTFWPRDIDYEDTDSSVSAGDDGDDIEHNPGIEKKVGGEENTFWPRDNDYEDIGTSVPVGDDGDKFEHNAGVGQEVGREENTLFLHPHLAAASRHHHGQNLPADTAAAAAEAAATETATETTSWPPPGKSFDQLLDETEEAEEAAERAVRNLRAARDVMLDDDYDESSGDDDDHTEEL